MNQMAVDYVFMMSLIALVGVSIIFWFTYTTENYQTLKFLKGSKWLIEESSYLKGLYVAENDKSVVIKRIGSLQCQLLINGERQICNEKILAIFVKNHIEKYYCDEIQKAKLKQMFEFKNNKGLNQQCEK